ncbi:PH domain-containing protein [Saccharopolyspora gloriosae]|uniref:PH domain-containing protein n=1 Tax=Saccharopolyspora gloriosae TaxID=455344 RepID=UPI002867E5D8|nr:PH domain-containing protein [Saccharopolyspora gloriosae]
MQSGEARSEAAGAEPADETDTSAGSVATVDQRPEDAARTVTVRPVKIRRVVIPVAIVLVVVFTVVAVLLRNTPTGVYFRISDQVAMAGLGVLLACGALLLARPRLHADLDGIEVRNIINTHHYSWDEVYAISFPDGAAWARLELAHDEYASVMAVQSTDGAHAVQAMRDLRDLRRAVDAKRDEDGSAAE